MTTTLKRNEAAELKIKGDFYIYDLPGGGRTYLPKNKVISAAAEITVDGLVFGKPADAAAKAEAEAVALKAKIAELEAAIAAAAEGPKRRTA